MRGAGHRRRQRTSGAKPVVVKTSRSPMLNTPFELTPNSSPLADLVPSNTTDMGRVRSIQCHRHFRNVKISHRHGSFWMLFERPTPQLLLYSVSSTLLNVECLPLLFFSCSFCRRRYLEYDAPGCSCSSLASRISSPLESDRVPLM